MQKQLFKDEAMVPSHPNWEKVISRKKELYQRENDVRSHFFRDYTRVLHCTAYRRLKHKTQVFFATENDHVCTRIEHVNHVASISWTIAQRLGLNYELVLAAASGHDLGHAPFGHTGERILNQLAKEYVNESFWHEKNSLTFVDKYETLPSPDGTPAPLNLTYGVRDAIVCHCGEVDKNNLYPRTQAIDLEKIKSAGEVESFTWEGCVVKITDKIAYLGRDLEDARQLNIIHDHQIEQLAKDVKKACGEDIPVINNTVLIHRFINDLCEHSTPDTGIGFSKGYAMAMNCIKQFCYDNIYPNERLNVFVDYANLMICSIFNKLERIYDASDLDSGVNAEALKYNPELSKIFLKWLKKYQGKLPITRREYNRLIIHFISAMTDSFTIKLFHELIEF